jgi:hypothetical protein
MQIAASAKFEEHVSSEKINEMYTLRYKIINLTMRGV